MFYIGLYRENMKKSFETTRTRALIFCMWHHLADLYQVFFSNYAPGAKMGPLPGHIGFFKINFFRVAYQIKLRE